MEGLGRELVDLFTKLEGFMSEVADFCAEDTDLGTDEAGFDLGTNKRLLFVVAAFEMAGFF